MLHVNISIVGNGGTFIFKQLYFISTRNTNAITFITKE